MRFVLAVVALLLLAAPQARAEDAFSIDLERVINVALQRVQERWPNVDAADLLLERAVYFNCPSTDRMERAIASGKAMPSCWARVSFTLADTMQTMLYFDEHGSCKLARSYEILYVVLKQDGSAEIRDGEYGTDAQPSGDCSRASDYVPRCAHNPLTNPDSCR